MQRYKITNGIHHLHQEKEQIKATAEKKHRKRHHPLADQN